MKHMFELIFSPKIKRLLHNIVAVHIFCFTLLGATTSMQAQTKITFPSLDSLTITADLYEKDPTDPVIVLCHQSKYSRGEFMYTAKKLNQIGFTCIAVDLRSGLEINKIKNETAALALKKKLRTDYLDAEQDIIAAVEYAAKKYDSDVILLGSSYSASLALKVAMSNEHVSAVLAFSPGEYFQGKLNIQKSINGLNKPVFLASTKEESSEVKKLYNVISSPERIQYIPDPGVPHASRALWPESPGSNELWVSVDRFLRKQKRNR